MRKPTTSPRTYQTEYPRTPECDRCGNDLGVQLREGIEVTVVVWPTSNPKRARQEFICYGCTK